MSHDPKPFDEGELDRLLHQARWPEPRDEQLARLERELRVLSLQDRLRRRRRLQYGLLAAAASLLVAVGAWTWRGGELPLAKREDAGKPVARDAIQDPGPQRAIAEPRQRLPEPELVREPNAYERTVVAAWTTAGRAPQAVKFHPGEIESLIAELGADPQVDLTSRIPTGRRDLARCEQLALSLTRHAEPAMRLGAVRMLAQIGSERSLPALVTLLPEPALHEAASLALARLARDADLVGLAAAEKDKKLQQKLLAALLARDTADSTALALQGVNDSKLRGALLSAAESMDTPPVDSLLAYLDHSQAEMRLAAAEVLGRLRDPAIARRVCEQVWGIGRQEALIALLINRGPQAADCLAHASRDPYLQPALLAAQQRLFSMHSQSGGNLP